jgi:hypothetical protein
MCVWGSPAEYAKGVLAGVDLAQSELIILPAGKLTINCAAHGAVGSCEVGYEHLTGILIKLFNAGAADPSDEDLVKLFPSTVG